MFEEIPGRGRLRGVRIDLQRAAGPARRRVTVGPFVVGGGVALAALSGSVALAATLITASTIRIVSSSPSHSGHVRAVAAASANQASDHTVESGAVNTARPQVLADSAADTGTAGGAGLRSARSTGPHAPAGAVAPFAQTHSAGGPQSGPQASNPVAAPSTSGPAGNALIFLDGYEAASSSLLFRYATVTPGAGPDGSDVFSDDGSAEQYRAQLADGASIVSGSAICPPAGNHCTAAQLISAAPSGIYAEVAIDPRGQLESVLERDNVPNKRTAAPAPSASATPSATAQPSASPNTPGGGSATG